MSNSNPILETLKTKKAQKEKLQNILRQPLQLTNEQKDELKDFYNNNYITITLEKKKFFDVIKTKHKTYHTYCFEFQFIDDIGSISSEIISIDCLLKTKKDVESPESIEDCRLKEQKNKRIKSFRKAIQGQITDWKKMHNKSEGTDTQEADHHPISFKELMESFDMQWSGNKENELADWEEYHRKHATLKWREKKENRPGRPRKNKSNF